MASRSDLSGAPIGTSDPASVTVVLDSGERHRLRVTASEAEELTAKGADVTHPLHRVGATARKAARKVLPWIAALAATLLLTNEVAKLYADRQQELDLKSALTTDISRASIRTYLAAFDAVDSYVDGGRPRMAMKLRDRAQQGWVQATANVDPLMHLHFEGSLAHDHWNRYQIAVYALAELAHPEPRQHTDLQVETIRRYLQDYLPTTPPSPPGDRDPWTFLACRTESCRRSDQWREYYRWIGLGLMSMRGALAQAILESEAENLG